VVLGSDEHDAQIAAGHSHDPAIRRRGAGTDVAANA
jgi:hypothetical protein